MIRAIAQQLVRLRVAEPSRQSPIEARSDNPGSIAVSVIVRHYRCSNLQLDKKESTLAEPQRRSYTWSQPLEPIS
jgi:hypothetical protein